LILYIYQNPKTLLAETLNYIFKLRNSTQKFKHDCMASATHDTTTLKTAVMWN